MPSDDGTYSWYCNKTSVYAMLEGTRILLSSNAVMYSNGTYNYKKLFEHLFDNIMEFEDVDSSLNLFVRPRNISSM